MGFRDCLISAVEQGAISRAEAADLADRFDEQHAQLRLSLPADEAAAAAKAKLAADLRAEAIEQRRRTALTDGARGRLKTYLQDYRDLSGKADVFEAVLNKFEHFGIGGTTAIAGKSKAIIALAHGQLTDVMLAFRRTKLLGRRPNEPLQQGLVKGLFGEEAGPQAKALAGAVSDVFEALRQRFNAAGGAIGELEKWGLPQRHDAGALLKAGRVKWRETVKPMLDRAAMKDPLTGGALTDARLDQVLDWTWAAIATDGASAIEPAMRRPGRGALASQRADHRFLIFKNADTWMTYARTFGEPDPIKAIFDHINGMANDIAAMEELGPNPSAMVEWLKQVVRREGGNAIAGKPSLFDAPKWLGKMAPEATADRIAGFTDWRIDSVFAGLRGRGTASRRVATFMSSARNLLTSAMLGSASLVAATTDPVLDMLARRLTGLPMTKGLTAITKTFSGATREQALRAGFILDDYLHVLRDEARFAGMIGGSEWSKWAADRTMKLSGLEPMTQARKHVFQLEFAGALADNADKRLADMDPMLARWFRGYGISESDWSEIRATPLFRTDAGVTLLRPSDIANRALAEKVLEMIHGQTERAVPSGTIRAKTYVTGMAERGTIAGEILESFLQFKSFGLSLTTLQLQAMHMELHRGTARGAGYASALLIGLTLAGGLGIQLRQIAQGKDPQPMDDTRFWAAALQTGGGFGIFGDFLFSDTGRFGHSALETLAGPALAFGSDTIALTTGNGFTGLFGKDMNLGRDLTAYAGRYTPVLSSLWYARTAYKRVLLDQLQYMVDPDAHRQFRKLEKRTAKDFRQGFWWAPGAALPNRMPDLANAFPGG